ncbi:MAG: 30S ribosomal protein S15 [Candidatus Mcinerneyibacterium aminivorans]|uniref:Small ribosomal subunit protein uS15 n=1 Tax=Candidatus Mcinerneyibacterium aminivorans TaxID=2703815 RepID=A0A5D0MG27_9BACT|nr:MAG: 30S ribosomal protein S15 [Candidatus Mcinerneyibacterium aminivorans]
MTLSKERKREIIEEFGNHENDTGSAEVQVALLTERISDLQDHFKDHPHDHHSRRGLLRMVGRRKKLLKYLKRMDIEKYREITKKLGIRG